MDSLIIISGKNSYMRSVKLAIFCTSKKYQAVQLNRLV